MFKNENISQNTQKGENLIKLFDDVSDDADLKKDLTKLQEDLTNGLLYLKSK